MDVRDRLHSPQLPEAPPPGAAAAAFTRGRRRRRRRQLAAGASGVAAVLLVAIVAWPAVAPDAPIVDDVADAPTLPETAIDPEEAPDPPDRAAVPEPDPDLPPVTYEVGDVLLTVPEGVVPTLAGPTALPCHAGLERPMLHVLEAIDPQAAPRDCPDRPSGASSIVAVAVSRVPPALLPGHATPAGGDGTEEVELLDTTGLLAVWERDDGTAVHTYAFPDLDLFLEARDPELTEGFVEALLASAERVEEDDEPISAPPIDGEASTDDRVRDPGGAADLVVTDVRVGTHDGFDRVAIELAGEGTVGWFTDLGSTAYEDGSGTVVDVTGDAVLTIALNAVAFPPELPDPGVRWDGDRIPAPAQARVLTEVVDSVVHEGQHQLFLGLTEAVPYRIVRYGDPQVVVVDLLHPSGP